MFTILFYIFMLFLVCIVLGFAIAVVICVPQIVFSLPYVWWVLGQKEVGLHKEIQTNSIFRNTGNAMRTYKAWMKRTPPVLR